MTHLYKNTNKVYQKRTSVTKKNIAVYKKATELCKNTTSFYFEVGGGLPKCPRAALQREKGTLEIDLKRNIGHNSHQGHIGSCKNLIPVVFSISWSDH